MAEQRTDNLLLSIYINVVLSFLFMAIGVPVLLWLLALLVAPGWHLFMLHPHCAGECWQLARFSDSVMHSIIIRERIPDSRSEAVKEDSSSHCVAPTRWPIIG